VQVRPRSDPQSSLLSAAVQELSGCGWIGAGSGEPQELVGSVQPVCLSCLFVRQYRFEMNQKEIQER
jgi:hypothetical protein